ncbi:hypothetical protein TNIN_233671, partial [Trichonephila inaurata madagascariensis]
MSQPSPTWTEVNSYRWRKELATSPQLSQFGDQITGYNPSRTSNVPFKEFRWSMKDTENGKALESLSNIRVSIEYSRVALGKNTYALVSFPNP